jgi:N-acetylmuramoyl-L-alanine amidase
VGYADGTPIPAGKVLRVLRDTAAPCVILEPFFGDNASDSTAATLARNEGRLPAAIARACADLIEGWRQ